MYFLFTPRVVSFDPRTHSNDTSLSLAPFFLSMLWILKKLMGIWFQDLPATNASVRAILRGTADPADLRRSVGTRDLVVVTRRSATNATSSATLRASARRRETDATVARVSFIQSLSAR